jgi:hypothetical protein
MLEQRHGGGDHSLLDDMSGGDLGQFNNQLISREEDEELLYQNLSGQHMHEFDNNAGMISGGTTAQNQREEPAMIEEEEEL